jgi:uncharacterized protein (TIGR03435 family)
MFFVRRGAVLPAAVLAGSLSTQAVQAAPAGLAAASATAAALKGASVAGSTSTLIKTTIELMAWTKLKIATVVGAGVLLAAGTATVTVKEILDHRTYPWQLVDANTEEGVKALNTAPHQVTIVPSKFGTDHRHTSLLDDIPPRDQWRFIGIHATPVEVIRRAWYRGFLLPSQIILPADMPAGYYDYIANLPRGSQQALQALIRRRLGLAAKYEMRDMDVLLLKVDHPHASGLQPAAPLLPGQPPPRSLETQGTIHFKNLPISKLCTRLAQDLQLPVLDQTGLTGGYDLDYPELRAIAPSEKKETIGQVLLDGCGLAMVPSREPIETLVVERVKK